MQGRDSGFDMLFPEPTVLARGQAEGKASHNGSMLDSSSAVSNLPCLAVFALLSIH